MLAGHPACGARRPGILARMALPPIAIIGAGNMGGAIIAGLLQLDEPPRIAVCDASEQARARMQAAGVSAHDSVAAAIAEAKLVILAVKPQQLDGLLAELTPALQPEQVLISILAGTTCARLEAGLPPGQRVVRAMPNTPMAIGLGMIAIAPGRDAGETELDLADSCFRNAGAVLRVTEEQMDAVTAVSGSGPAYLFRFAEALQAAAMQLGFDRAQSALLVGQTLEGAVRYLRSQPDFPAAQLREAVTSPGGTTAAALEELEQADFAALLSRAVHAARDRSRELAGS